MIETGKERRTNAAYLMDVNALIAAIWTDHVNHTVTDAWVQGKVLATCPLSELGFLRIASHPNALGATMEEARSLLRDFLQTHSVRFVPADMPALNAHAKTSAAATDGYLADLAQKHGLRLATLDGGISHPAAEHIGR